MRAEGWKAKRHLWSNGVRLRKVITVDQLRKDHEKGYQVVGYTIGGYQQ